MKGDPTIVPEQFDHVLIDGKYPATVVLDGYVRSLLSGARSDGQPGEERGWFDNDRLTVLRRRRERATGGEQAAGIELY